MSPPKAGAQTKIGQFDVSIFIDQNIVWLDVTMDETHLVDAFYCACQLGNVKPIYLKRKTTTDY